MSGFSKTSLAGLAFVAETTEGTTPTTGNHKALRFTGETLDAPETSITSNEIRDDRQKTDIIETSVDVTGAINIEWSYKEYDDFIRGTLQGTWSDTDATITATFTTTTLTASAGTPFVNVVDGQWVLISDAATPANNGWFQVLDATSSTVLTFAAATFTAEGPTASVSVNSSRISNGTTQGLFSVERQQPDVPEYRIFKGLLPNKWSLSASSTDRISGSFDFKGMSDASDTATQLPGTKAASQTYSITNGVRSIAGLTEGGVAMTGVKLQKFDFSIDNAGFAGTALGHFGNVAVDAGSVTVTVSAEAYFNSGARALQTKFKNKVYTSFGFRIVDGANNGYAFTLPHGKITKFNAPVGAIDKYCMATFEMMFVMDPTLLKTLIIDRCGA